MNEISIPTHLVIPAIVSFGIILIIGLNGKKLIVKSSKNLFWISLIVFFAFYGLIVGLAGFTDINYQIELNSFDLNKDGFFSGEELTEEYEAASLRLISDLERNFTVFTGIFWLAIAIN